MTKPEMIAAQLRGAMASIEAAYALLGVEEQEPDTNPCEHPEESRQELKAGGWGCKECGHREGG